MPVAEDGSDPAEVVIRSTECLPIPTRAAYWREAIEGAFPGLAVDWLGDRPIRARLESRPFADIRVTSLRNTPVRVTHTPQAGARHRFQLVLHLAGHGGYLHAGRETGQAPGDLVLLDTALPFVSVFEVGFRLLVWDLPREALLPLLVAPGRAIGQRIPGRRGAGAVLASHARALAAEAGRLDATAQQNLKLHLCSLVALTLGDGAAAREVRAISYRAARRQQILAYVEVRLRDGRLTAERAARDLGISRRWLYALFEETGTSFAAWIARRRVEECRKMLSDPAHDHLSIAEIAFHNGFDDLSTFNRQFRAHCGVTPREARRTRPIG